MDCLDICVDEFDDELGGDEGLEATVLGTARQATGEWENFRLCTSDSKRLHMTRLRSGDYK